ncbi:MAG: helix-turn-helix transcriptional regulator [Candidatus Bathyarchaeia archaeon]|jgi:uncharacterized membrane protein
MKRVNLSLISLLASVIALLTLTIIGFNVPYSSTSQYPNSMGDHMSGMMGQTATSIATANETSGYFWTAFAVISAVLAISVVCFAYYLAYPQVKIGPVNNTKNQASTQTSNITPSTNGSLAYESIEKTFTEDEHKVINTINLHQGKYLQKYITKETGLSKLKTHRIVARLSERGIVTLEKTGNTNMVYLADWLKKKEESNP